MKAATNNKRNVKILHQENNKNQKQEMNKKTRKSKKTIESEKRMQNNSQKIKESKKKTESKHSNEKKIKWRLPNLFGQKVVSDELLPLGYLSHKTAPDPKRHARTSFFLYKILIIKYIISNGIKYSSC